MAGNVDMAAQDSSSREALEMRSGQLFVDNLQAELIKVKTSLEGSENDARKELGVLLTSMESVAASLRYLSSKPWVLTVSDPTQLSIGAEQLELEDDILVAKNQDSLLIEDGSYTCKMLRSIQMITVVMESLLRRVTAAESETSFQKERVIKGEEEIRRKMLQIENLSIRLEEMKQIVIGNKAVLDETADIIKKLVEDSRRDREKAMENEEELRRMKTECESLKNFVNTFTNVRETLLSSERQFQTIEARLVEKLGQVEGEKAQKETEVQKLMKENLKLAALLDKKEAQILALNEQCKVMALNASNI